MPPNLPSTFGGLRPPSHNIINTPKNIGKIGIPSNIGRAQSTQVSVLQQKIDRDNARVSINQVLSAKAENLGQRTTSINRVGALGTKAYTSAARYQTNIKASVNDQNSYDPNAQQNDEASNDRRYTYMRKLIKQRQAKEKELQKEQSTSPLSVGTGHSMHHSGTGGFHKQVSKFFRDNRTKFSHLSSEQKGIFEKTIEDKLEHKATGSQISRFDRIAMKKQLDKAHEQGKINLHTTQQFKKIIGKIGT